MAVNPLVLEDTIEFGLPFEYPREIFTVTLVWDLDPDEHSGQVYNEYTETWSYL